MAPRAIWKGHIKLDELTCPVALYSAASTSERVSFHTLNRKTGVVVILALRDTVETVRQLLESEAGHFSLRFIPEPEGATEDWLVTSLASDSEEG